MHEPLCMRICRYRAQLIALRRAFDLRTDDEKSRVEFQTVDGFQV